MSEEIRDGTEYVDLIKLDSPLGFEPTTEGIKLIVLEKLINRANKYISGQAGLEKIILPTITVLEGTTEPEALTKIEEKIEERRKKNFAGREYFVVRKIETGNSGHRFLIFADYSGKTICIFDAFGKSHTLSSPTLEGLGWGFVTLVCKLQYNSGACEGYAYYLPFLLEKMFLENPRLTIKILKNSFKREAQCISESLFSNPASTSRTILLQYRTGLVKLFGDMCTPGEIEQYYDEDCRNIGCYLEAVAQSKAPRTEVLTTGASSTRTPAEELPRAEVLRIEAPRTEEPTEELPRAGTLRTEVGEARRTEEKIKPPKGGFIFHSQQSDAKWLRGLTISRSARMPKTQYQELLEARRCEFEARLSQVQALQQKNESEQIQSV